MKKIVLKLAEVIERILGEDHSITIPNTMRYCNRRDVLRAFCIRENTDVKLGDWEQAIDLVKSRKSEPIEPVKKEIVTKQLIIEPHRDWKLVWKERINRKLAGGFISHARHDQQSTLISTYANEADYLRVLKSLLKRGNI